MTPGQQNESGKIWEYEPIDIGNNLTAFENWLRNHFLRRRGIRPLERQSLIDAIYFVYELYRAGNEVALYLRVKDLDSEAIAIIPEALRLRGPDWKAIADDHVSDLRRSIREQLLSRNAQRDPSQTVGDEDTTRFETSELPVAGRYGRDRDMSIEQVREIVRQLIEYRKRGGKVPEFYRRVAEPDKYSLETLRSWLYDLKMHPTDCDCDKCRDT